MSRDRTRCRCHPKNCVCKATQRGRVAVKAPWKSRTVFDGHSTLFLAKLCNLWQQDIYGSMSCGDTLDSKSTIYKTSLGLGLETGDPKPLAF